MMTDLERICNKIRENGYLSVTRVTLELFNINSELTSEEIDKMLKDIVGDGIHRIEYTNRYVAPYTRKGLYIYNPTFTDKPKTVRKTKARVDKPKTVKKTKTRKTKKKVARKTRRKKTNT